MEKKRFKEEQIIGFLREAQVGMLVKDLCRKHGFSEASFYLWRSKYGGIGGAEAFRVVSLVSRLECKQSRRKTSAVGTTFAARP